MCIRDRHAVIPQKSTVVHHGKAGKPFIGSFYICRHGAGYFVFIAQNRFAAVSYTHLDVYKRQDVVGYEQLNERQRDVMELIVNQMDSAPDTIVLGSSRIMQMNTEIAQTDSLFNCALTGADWYDMLGTFYLFDKANKLPKNVIIGFDPVSYTHLHAERCILF